MVSDKQILDAYKLLAEKEGVFVEPASASSIAGLLMLAKKKYFINTVDTRSRGNKVTKIVCILTGHGLKDPDRVIKTVKKPKIVKVDAKAILKEIGY